ncbi:hypothetical protein [Escherichia coli]|uniref:hypothetical protein n=2 Tax=Escherichia coli TaxID=562 RepID=UPI000F867F49|nr:hypothetical protein [Escherichia coli]MBE0974234.1 hypothetical protein [Escherichia coli]MED8900385.1 hypothetical protein [Escherichia coli]MED9567186.1 hypothetical protein [Escherichia coli]HBA6347858.1 hypothetical protein [Escherichia coli]HBM9133675.1 hypothetical protein [Escherichia coli]
MSLNPEPQDEQKTTNTREQSRGYKMEFKPKKTIKKIVKTYEVITEEELPEEIIFDIEIRENEVGGPISEEEFQSIIMDKAIAYAIHDRENDRYIKGMRLSEDGKCIRFEWTRNIRNAFIFNNESKASILSLYINGKPRGCNIVPLIYQVDPFFKYQE